MVIIIDPTNRSDERVVLRSMFEARKRVFIDLLKWDLPVLADRFEVDQFDDGHATYLVVADAGQRHLASARLLQTTRPALLDTLFPELCDGAPPHGENIFEITRFCLSPGAGAAIRRQARDQLLTALVEFAQSHQIATYTGVAEIAWFQQILAFGWDCMPLGSPRLYDGRMLAALRIDIAGDTLTKLASAGIGIDAGCPSFTARAA